MVESKNGEAPPEHVLAGPFFISQLSSLFLAESQSREELRSLGMPQSGARSAARQGLALAGESPRPNGDLPCSHVLRHGLGPLPHPGLSGQSSQFLLHEQLFSLPVAGDR